RSGKGGATRGNGGHGATNQGDISMRPTTLLLAAAISLDWHIAAAQGAPRSSLGPMPMTGAAALPLGVPMSRVGPGTSWLPDSAREPNATFDLHGWNVMVGGSAFGQYDRQAGRHGGRRADDELRGAGRRAARLSRAAGDGRRVSRIQDRRPRAPERPPDGAGRRL